MIYFTISKDNVVDSISKNFTSLKLKFPNETIYKSDTPLISVFINKDELNEIRG